ncbi:hypothetical protein [Oceanobacter sp. 3_MG-2023]|uniref:hypothetical protein n=1 Tax=Oceanobacter sp. 3_MG-2023 TaxID=3062622 RepID=UPI0027377744|nr:hypothetical protein [Oceanobacter sp. 3_MG-2023]MDP2505637.1 hypothetical protein [Oceanobacter sp. 3_MG-2023]
MVAVEYWSIGDTAELDRIESELGATSEAVAATASAVAELEANGGIVFPYDPVIAENIKVFSDIGFKAAARRHGDHWVLPPEDNERLSVAMAQVVHHYMPDFDQLGPVGNLGMIAVSILGPRMVLTKMQNMNSQVAANDEGVKGE